MSKDILQLMMIIQNIRYLKDLDSSAKKLYMRSSGSIGYEAYIGSYASVEWSWSPRIIMSSSYFFSIITTFLSYI